MHENAACFDKSPEYSGEPEYATDLFDFELPPERIALWPEPAREQAKLLVSGREQLTDHHVSDLPALLRSGDVLVFNDARVAPSRLHGMCAGPGAGRMCAGPGGTKRTIELLLTFPPEITESGTRWRALARPARRAGAGTEITLGHGITARVHASDPANGGGRITLDIEASHDAVLALCEEWGEIPLPPYIAKRRRPAPSDRERYQTVFADRPCACAAPTAGLHFSPSLLDRLARAGIALARVTLQVGPGTFLPVRTRDARDHRLDPEWGEIPHAAFAAIEGARARGGRVIAVGTTVCRLLESAAREQGGALSGPWSGWARACLLPGSPFHVVERLVTNFHLPRSSLFMLVCAFAGRTRMLDLYRHAIAGTYRFYSYGDCCLIDPPR